jgi:peptide deformylase
MITVNTDILKTKSLPWDGTDEEFKALISILEFELLTGPVKGGFGLSAIQINVPYRVAILRSKNTKLDIYNAEIIKTEQPFVFKQEGCLSMPGVNVDTNRFNIIILKNGDGKEYKLSGFDAVLAQHEIAHWDGKLMTDFQAEGDKK